MLGWHFRRLSSALVGLMALLALSATAGAADYNWKFQSFWQAGTTNQKVFERFAANVARMSGDRIEIEALSVGAVVPPGEMLDSVKVGIIDGNERWLPAILSARTLPSRCWPTSMPATKARISRRCGSGTVAASTSPVTCTRSTGSTTLGRSCGVRSPSRRRCRFAALRISRASRCAHPRAWGAAIFRRLDVGVSTLPGTEVYTALERGKIEATDWGTLGMNDELGYGKIAPYAIYPGIHSMPMSDVSINLDTWDGLPDDLKAIIEIAAREMNRDSLGMNAVLDRSLRRQAGPFDPYQLGGAPSGASSAR